MKRFEQVPEPPGWADQAREKGRKWLDAHPYTDRVDGKARPPRYWTGREGRFRRILRDGFHGLCAYSVVRTPVGTVDHFIPWASLFGTDREILAYEWSNLRFCAEWVNCAKGAEEWPDPFTLDDDWFELLLPSLQLRATAAVPDEYRAVVDRALRVLGHSQNAIESRQDWFDGYQRGGITLAELRRHAPLIARAMDRDPRWLNRQDRSKRKSL